MYEKNFDGFKFCDLTEEYIDQTAHLLNQEWSRSLSLRKYNLQSSVNQARNTLTLPVSLILIQTSTNKVIGHTSINSIAVISDKPCDDGDKLVEFENLAFLQSVIIDKELRGKGLGKKLMELSETYLLDYGRQDILKKQNTNTDYMFLTTKDKQKFYESLGYSQIEPIKFYSVKANKCTEIMKRLYSKKSQNENTSDTNTSNTSITSVNLISHAIGSPPPPPPPPLPSNFSDIDIEANDSKITWYKKCLISK
jgi:ribosomal protein S18 acetylase RimI-like enzyme